MTIEQWLKVFRASKAEGPVEVMKEILDHIDGYGFDHGYDENKDAQNLWDAMRALGWLGFFSGDMKSSPRKED